MRMAVDAGYCWPPVDQPDAGRWAQRHTPDAGPTPALASVTWQPWSIAAGLNAADMQSRFCSRSL